MKPKVKIIEALGSAISLESEINQFLQNIDVDNFIDIKLSSLEGIDASSGSTSSLTNDKHVALIMYLEWLYLLFYLLIHIIVAYLNLLVLSSY